MTHERIANVEGGEYGEDWLEDAGSIEPVALDREVGDAQMPKWDPVEYASACAEADVTYENLRRANG